MKRGGGVSLLIRSHIPFISRNDLAHFDSEMESVFIEIGKSVFQSNANKIIGLVYRMPDSSVDVFNEKLADIWYSIQKGNKLFYLLGDLNIDLFKHDVHGLTSAFLDTIYSYNVYPLITKPTRVTISSAILIDQILPTILIYHMDIPKAYHVLVCLIILPYFTLLVTWAQRNWLHQCH